MPLAVMQVALTAVEVQLSWSLVTQDQTNIPDQLAWVWYLEKCYYELHPMTYVLYLVSTSHLEQIS